MTKLAGTRTSLKFLRPIHAGTPGFTDHTHVIITVSFGTKPKGYWVSLRPVTREVVEFGTASESCMMFSDDRAGRTLLGAAKRYSAKALAGHARSIKGRIDEALAIYFGAFEKADEKASLRKALNYLKGEPVLVAGPVVGAKIETSTTEPTS